MNEMERFEALTDECGEMASARAEADRDRMIEAANEGLIPWSKVNPAQAKTDDDLDEEVRNAALRKAERWF